MKKKVLFLVGSLMVGVVFLIVALWRVGLVSIAQLLDGLLAWQFLAIVLVTLAMVVVWVLRWRVILTFYGVSVDWRTMVQARLAGHAISTLTPAFGLGGEPAQYFVVKDSKPPVASTPLVASLVIDKMVFATMNVLLILVGVVLFITTFSLSTRMILILIGSILILLWLVLVVYHRTFKKRGFISSLLHIFGLRKETSLMKKIEGAEALLHEFFRWRNPYLWQLLGLSVLRAVVYSFRFWLVALILGAPLLLTELLVVVGVILLVGALPIPGGLGGFELSQSFVFGSLGLGAGVGVSVVLIIRAMDLGLASIGLFVLVSRSFKHFWPFAKNFWGNDR